METKRKKTVVTMLTRLEAISRMDKGEPLRKIAEEYNVGTSTVSDWKRNRKVIENFCAKMISKDCLANRVTAKQANDKFLDFALYNWYTQERSGGHISGPVLQAKALELNKELGGNPTFCASTGWLSRWKARHGIAFQQVPGAARLAKSSGDGTYSRTSSTGTPYTTTSATTTCGTTSSFTTTSLTTVSVTTTFSTTTTPSSRIYTAGCEPFTSSFAASIIKEELDIGSSNLKTEFDNINFENTYNSVDQLEAEYAQQCGNKRRRNDDSVEQDANTTDNTLHDEDDEKNSEGTEPEEPNTTPEPEEDCENRDMSDLLGSADTLDLRLNSILADNIFNCCNINPTRTRQHTHPPSSSSSREPYSTARLRYLDLEQRLRVYYLKTMIRKEEELMNIKVEVNKLHLMRDKLESENSRAAHLLRMENLHLENRLLKLRLQLMVQ